MADRIFYLQPDHKVAYWTSVSRSFEYFDSSLEEICGDKLWPEAKVEAFLRDAGDVKAFLRAVKIIRIEHGVNSREYQAVAKWDDENILNYDLAKSVWILNTYRHNFDSVNLEEHHSLAWEVTDDLAVLVRKDIVLAGDFGCHDYYECLTGFEAASIAVEYVREAGDV